MSHTHPVNHLLQVAKVANTEACLRTEREERDQCSCNANGWEWESSFCQLIYKNVTFLHCRQCQGAIVAVFPYNILVIIIVLNEELHLNLVSNEFRSI